MKSRTMRKTVVLAQPFSLRGCDQSLEAGVYLIETDEELLEGLSFRAYQRTKTSIHLHEVLGRPGTGRILSVDGDDLDTAIYIERAARDRKSREKRDIDALADLHALDRAENEGMAFCDLPAAPPEKPHDLTITSRRRHA